PSGVDRGSLDRWAARPRQIAERGRPGQCSDSLHWLPPFVLSEQESPSGALAGPTRWSSSPPGHAYARGSCAASRLPIVAAGPLALLTAGPLHVLTPRTLDVLATGPLCVLTPQTLDVLATGPLCVLTPRARRVLTAGGLNALLGDRGTQTAGRHQREHKPREPHDHHLAIRTVPPFHRSIS